MTAKLWKVLAKYHQIPDHFHNLKTTLQTNFELLKTATTRNTQNLLNLLKQQQTCTTAVGEHINTLYTKLAQLEQQIQVHCIYLHNTTDEVQLQAPAYNPNIDGHSEQQENSTNPKEIHNTSSIQPQDPAQQNSTRTEDISSSIQWPITSSTEENRSEKTYCTPELEEEEDWENSQFQDIDFNHIHEGDHIR